MRRPSLAEPPLAAELLHPTLQAALSSLDVQLEVELARYRRQRRRTGRAKPSAAPKAASPQQRNAKPLDLIAIGAIGGRTQPRQAASPEVALDLSGSLDQDLWQDQSLDGSTAAGHLTIASHPPLQPAATDAAASSQTASMRVQSDPGLNAPVLETDDYFASSEQLLRSLTEEAALQTPSKNWLTDLLTPLGIGSLLLLLLSSATIGYLILNPASLRIFETFGIHKSSQNDSIPGAAGEATASPNTTSPDLASEEFKNLNLDTLSTLPKGNPESSDRSPIAPATATPTIAASPTASPATPVEGIPGVARIAPGEAARSPRVVPSAPLSQPASPQPATRRRSPEVAVLHTPLRSRSTAAPQAAPTRRSAARPSHASVPRPATRVTTPPRSVLPAPSIVPPPSAATAPAAQDSLHYVVIPYSGDRSLEQARQAAPGAYVRNFPNGARIQLGAFSDPARARELSQQLEHQGVSAQVYQP